jgi:hypothetical protein
MSRSCVTKRLRLRFSRFTSSGFIPLAALALIFCLVPQNVYAVDVTLAWNSNSEEDLAGYRILYRQEGQSYNYQEPAWQGPHTICRIVHSFEAKEKTITESKKEFFWNATNALEHSFGLLDFQGYGFRGEIRAVFGVAMNSIGGEGQFIDRTDLELSPYVGVYVIMALF